MCINYSLKYDFKYTIVRYHNVYGPNMGHEHVMPQFIRKLVKKEKFTVEGDGKETRAFCYIDDAINGTILVEENESEKERIFNIGNPEEVSMRELISSLSNVANEKINPIFIQKDNPGTKRRCPDITKAMLAGYNPHIMLKEGLVKTFNWYKKIYSEKK